MPGRIVGYHHVNQNISRDSIDAVRRFYSDLLGLEEISPGGQDPTGNNLIWFNIGEGQLHLAICNKPDQHSSRHFAVLVNDFDDLIKHLEHGGATLHECEPGQFWGRRPTGRKYAFCFDPVGNRIELMEDFG